MFSLFKSIFDLSRGTIIAQLVGIIILPIITRLYTADEFGQYSLIVQLSILFGILLNLRQEQTIQLENNPDLIRSHIYHKNRFFVYLIYIISAILLISTIANMGTGILISVICGIFLILIGYLCSLQIFECNYSSVGFSELLNKLIFSIFAIFSVNFFSFFNLGFAYLIGLASKYRYLLFKSRLKRNNKNQHSYSLSRQAGFSSSISHLLLAATSIVPMFTINEFYSSQDLGYYSMAISVIFLPSAVISISIGNVYFEKLIKDKNNFLNLFFNVMVIAFVLAILIFTPFFFYSELIFEFVLGPDWIKAGAITSILVFPAFVGFITGCFDRTCFILKNNYHAPIWHFFRALFTSSACLFCIYSELTIEGFIFILSVGQIILYLSDFSLQIYYGLQLKKKFKPDNIKAY